MICEQHKAKCKPSITTTFISAYYLLHVSSFVKYYQEIKQYVKKGKAVPLQAWTGPEGSRKSRFPDFMTTAQEVATVVILTHRPPLPPGNSPGTHFS